MISRGSAQQPSGLPITALCAEYHAKFLANPVRPNSDETQKQFLVHILDQILGEVIPTESQLYSVEIAHADRQPIRFSKAFYAPAMCILSRENQSSVHLTKAAVLRHIAAAQP